MQELPPPPPPKKPILKKPPGYRDPNSTSQKHPTTIKPIPKKPPSSIPPSLQPKNRQQLLRHRQPIPPPPSRRRRWRRTCCCIIFLTLLLILLTLTITTSILYLYFTPKSPIFQLKQITFNRFNATTADGLTYLTSRATVWVQLKNPNGKLTVYYDEMEGRLLTEEETELGVVKRGGGFWTGTGNVTVLRFGGVGVDKMEIEGGTGGRLKERVRKGVAKVRVELKMRIGVGVVDGKKGRIGMLPVGVLCGGGGGIRLNQIGKGRAHKCKIDFFRWMKLNG